MNYGGTLQCLLDIEYVLGSREGEHKLCFMCVSMLGGELLDD